MFKTDRTSMCKPVDIPQSLAPMVAVFPFFFIWAAP